MPWVLAALIWAPRPVVMRVLSFSWKYSATIEAFQAPPEAVTSPVINLGTGVNTVTVGSAGAAAMVVGAILVIAYMGLSGGAR